MLRLFCHWYRHECLGRCESQTLVNYVIIVLLNLSYTNVGVGM